MGLARSLYVKKGEEGVYHCTTRCVRQAYLCGRDRVTNRDLSHRREWIVNRLRYLAGIFAVDVCNHAVLHTHQHNVLRTRPDIVAGWTRDEVADRWLTLAPPRGKAAGAEGMDTARAFLLSWPERIEELRMRLCDLSWFMKYHNEPISRAANAEDGTRGRFWESRYECHPLLDEGAIISCMVYVDLNPIRAGIASTPEASDFTGVQERIRRMKLGMGPTGSPGLLDDGSSYLCPIASNPLRRGILNMTETEYIELVDEMGRMLHPDKRGSIPSAMRPILERVGIKPDEWVDTICSYESRFGQAVGSEPSLRSYADRIGKRWVHGVRSARKSFRS
ncbi:MAG: transposase [Acidobacteria bacterium]|nr:transposase [Acidobacteriota bacterium]